MKNLKLDDDQFADDKDELFCKDEDDTIYPYDETDEDFNEEEELYSE